MIPNHEENNFITDEICGNYILSFLTSAKTIYKAVNTTVCGTIKISNHSNFQVKLIIYKKNSTKKYKTTIQPNTEKIITSCTFIKLALTCYELDKDQTCSGSFYLILNYNCLIPNPVCNCNTNWRSLTE